MELPDRAVRTAAFPADRRQVHVYLGHLGIRRSDPDYAALVVMDRRRRCAAEVQSSMVAKN